MRIHQLSVADALASIRSSAAGLSADEASHRLREFDPNRVEQVTGEQLQRLSSTQLQLALDAPEIIFARVAADQKMRTALGLAWKEPMPSS